MGTYDTFIDGDIAIQVKVFENDFNTYKPGDKVPCDGSFVIVTPNEHYPYIIIMDGKFVGVTDCFKIIDKWGQELKTIEAFVDPFKEMVKEIVQTCSDTPTEVEK